MTQLRRTDVAGEAIILAKNIIGAPGYSRNKVTHTPLLEFSNNPTIEVYTILVSEKNNKKIKQSDFNSNSTRDLYTNADCIHC